MEVCCEQRTCKYNVKNWRLWSVCSAEIIHIDRFGCDDFTEEEKEDEGYQE